MNRLTALIPIFLLVSCGPSIEEKEEIATITCNILSASRNIDASMRIKEVNEAREKINADAFLGTDSDIKDAFEYGLCKELILADPEYKTKLNKQMQAEMIEEAKAAEERRIAAEKAAEERRIAAEKAAEERRIAEERRKIAFQKLAEEQRIAAEKLAEEQRIAEEKIRVVKEKNIDNYINSFYEVEQEYPIDVTMQGNFKFEKLNNELNLKIFLRCHKLVGLDSLEFVVVLKEDLGLFRHYLTPVYCGFTKTRFFIDLRDLDKNTRDLLNQKKSESLVDKIIIEWNGEIDMYQMEKRFDKFLDPYEKRDVLKKLNPKNFELSEDEPLIKEKLSRKWVIYESKDD